MIALLLLACEPSVCIVVDNPYDRASFVFIDDTPVGVVDADAGFEVCVVDGERVHMAPIVPFEAIP